MNPEPCPCCGNQPMVFMVFPEQGLDAFPAAPTMNGPSLPGVLLLAGLALAVIARRMRQRERR